MAFVCYDIAKQHGGQKFLGDSKDFESIYVCDKTLVKRKSYFAIISAGAGSVDGSTPATVTSAAGTGGAASGSGELAEDMLQMALRMASEMSEEPVMDLEDSVNPAPVRRG